MLTKAALARTAPAVRAQMGKSGEKFERLLALMSPDGAVNLAAALEALYPGEMLERSQAQLRQFRLELARAARNAGVELTLAGDKKTRSSPDERLLWFEGED